MNQTEDPDKPPGYRRGLVCCAVSRRTSSGPAGFPCAGDGEVGRPARPTSPWGTWIWKPTTLRGAFCARPAWRAQVLWANPCSRR